MPIVNLRMKNLSAVPHNKIQDKEAVPGGQFIFGL